MKMLFAAVAVAILLPCASAHADAPTSSPLLGSWAVDVSRIPRPPQERPKSVTLTFGQADDGKVLVRADIVEQSGGTLHAEGAATLDGRATPVKSSFEADTMALQRPAPNVLVMMLAKDRSGASTRIYTVAADGRSMTETVAAFAPDGSPAMRINYFTRVPAAAPRH
jgi:lipocalin